MRHACRLSTLPLALLLLLLPLLSGCPSQLGAIADSSLTAADKASASLFVIEKAWVNAKVALADTLTDLSLLGVSVGVEAKIRIRNGLRIGNQALDAAHAAIALGEVSTTSGRLASALSALQAATRALAGQTTALSAPPTGGTP